MSWVTPVAARARTVSSPAHGARELTPEQRADVRGVGVHGRIRRR